MRLATVAFCGLVLMATGCPPIEIRGTDTSNPEVVADTGSDGGGGGCETVADCEPFDCEDAACVEGVCEYTIKLNQCLIDDVCYLANGTAPTDFCSICNPSFTQEGFINKQCNAGEVCEPTTGDCVAAVADVVEGTTDVPAPDATPDGIEDTTADPGPDAPADVPVGDGSGGDATPDATADAVPDATADAVPDAAADAVPDTTPDAVPDAVPDATVDATGDATPDAVPDATPDAPMAGGDTCGDAIPLGGALPITVSSTTAGLTDDYSTLGTCADLNAVGAGQTDIVYSFTPAATGAFFAELANAAPNLLIVSTGCGNPNACVGALDLSTGPALLQLEGGVEHFLIVDGQGTGNEGAFEFTLSQCQPDCGSKACGDDGCGGTCGTCVVGQVCNDAFQCEAAGGLVGDTCVNPVVVDTSTLPVTIQGDTSDANLSASLELPGGSCTGFNYVLGNDSNDQFYYFQPPVDGTYQIELTDVTHDPVLMVLSGCDAPESSCVGASDAPAEGEGESVLVPLTADQPVVIVVDGYTASQTGAYTLNISEPCTPQCTGKTCGPDGCGGDCGSCAANQACTVSGTCVAANQVPGNTCTNPFTADVTSLPLSIQADLSGATDVFATGPDSCPGVPPATSVGGDRKDHVYVFTPTTPGVYTITSTGTDEPTALYVTTACGTVDSCVAFGYAEAGLPATVNLPTMPNATYYIIVDGVNTDASQYTLTISEPCQPNCQGKTCGPDGCGATCGGCANGQACDPQGQCLDPAQVPGAVCTSGVPIDTSVGFPLTINGDTIGMTSSIDIAPNQCTGVPFTASQGPDQWWTFVAPMDGEYQLDLTAPTADQGIYVFSGCADPVNDCIVGEDSLIAGQTETLTFSASQGTTYHFMVSGYGTGDEGPYELVISQLP